MTRYTIITQAKRRCPYCEKAAELLDQHDVPYSLRPLELEPLKEVAATANMSTVPIIYHGEDLIGGYTELQEHLGAKVNDLEQ